MRTAPRTAQLLVVLALFTATAGAVAGCGDESAGSATRPDNARARAVADAWDGSKAAEVWRRGYHPLGESVQLPEGAFRDGDDKRAYLTENLVLRGELPLGGGSEAGQVTWDSGGSLELPLMDAREAYDTLAGGGNDGPRLTVTGAKPGRMKLATSRGTATVPAWLFTIDGYDTPLRRVAVTPSKLPQPPIKPSPAGSDAELRPLDRLAEVADGGRSVTVHAHHGSCDDGPVVGALETDGSVVLSASVAGTRDGICTSDLRAKQVTVKLDRPVGDRILLDAFTGWPVPYGQTKGPSASGS
ncbi:hypothetical protein ACIP79_23235 [Streptomyces sp. NPDC088747]|uniref:hypothetical protein n=1 Tax=Streptomyces sp. NPDC088747 TaxID=3365886 RepID=UPI00380848B8